MTWRPLPGAGAPPPLRLSGALDQVARDLGAPSAGTLTVLFAQWEQIVGVAAAAHCQPLWLGGGTLVVAVDDPGRATEMRYRAGEVLARLADVAGNRVAERLEVRVRPR